MCDLEVLFRCDFSESLVGNKYNVVGEIGTLDVKVFAPDRVVVGVCDGQQHVVCAVIGMIGSCDVVDDVDDVSADCRCELCEVKIEVHVR